MIIKFRKILVPRLILLWPLPLIPIALFVGYLSTCTRTQWRMQDPGERVKLLNFIIVYHTKI